MARAALSKDGDNYVYKGHFSKLRENVRASSFWDIAMNRKRAIDSSQMAKRLLLVNMDLWNIATVLYRLNFEKDCRRERIFNNNQWRFYASLDIDLFFIKYRSFFDNVAQVIKLTGQVPPNKSNSFHDLKKWADSQEGQSANKYSLIVMNCDWFYELKDIRDRIEHHAAETNVDFDELTFKVTILVKVLITCLKEK